MGFKTVGRGNDSREIYQNWAGNHSCSPTEVARPRNENELSAVVSNATERGLKVRCVGAGHSFPDAALCDDVLISLDAMNRLKEADTEANTLKVEAGIRLFQLNELAEQYGLALENLGDIAYQSVAGAISTATHGTGLKFAGIADQVIALRLVTSTGSVVALNRKDDRDLFNAAVVSLGALGIISEVTLRCVPAFRLRAVEDVEPIEAVLEAWEDRCAGADHFEYFTLLRNEQVFTKTNTRTQDAAEPLSGWNALRDKLITENLAFGAMAAVANRLPSRIPQLKKLLASQVQPNTYIDTSYKVFASQRTVKFLEMEYALPLQAAPLVLQELNKASESFDYDVLFPIEVRCAAGDEAVLSTAHGRDSAYIAIHMAHKRDSSHYFSVMEDICLGYGGRPHWGKLHNLDSETLSQLYPKWQDFLAARDKFDPQRSFQNEYTKRCFGE